MFELTPLPFDEAIRFFQEKGLALSPQSWLDIWGAAHVRSFTVARVTAMDVLEDIRDSIERAMDQGVPLRQFQAELGTLLERRGWLARSGVDAEVVMPDGTVRKRLTPWRLDTIYRTNIQSAYQAGRYQQMMRVAPRRPYWMYDAVLDSRTRPSHAAMDGKVYRFDHPIWDRWYPPNGYNCRCTVRCLTESDLVERGLAESTSGASVQPDAGFEYNPGREKWQPDFNQYSPEGRRSLAEALGSMMETD